MKKVSVRELKDGSIIKLDCSPTKGHEQSGYRPVVVISNPNQKGMPFNDMVAVAPITRNVKKGFPAHVKLDNSTNTIGSVMLDQLRTMDLGNRKFQFVEEMSEENFNECKKVLKAILFNE